MNATDIVFPLQYASQPRAMCPHPRVDITTHRFEVALSFPGECRGLVQAVEQEVTAALGANTVFYDQNYQAQLARPSLDTLLQDIYGRRAKLIVVFAGGAYQSKTWPHVEWRAIRAVLNAATENHRIMHIKVDDGPVDGILQQDGYINASQFSPAQIAAFIVERAEFTAPLPPA